MNFFDPGPAMKRWIPYCTCVKHGVRVRGGPWEEGQVHATGNMYYVLSSGHTGVLQRTRASRLDCFLSYFKRGTSLLWLQLADRFLAKFEDGVSGCFTSRDIEPAA